MQAGWSTRVRDEELTNASWPGIHLDLGATCMCFWLGAITPMHGVPFLPSFLPTLPCLVLLRTPCSCACGSVTLWGWLIKSWVVLMCLAPLIMLLMMH